MLCLWKAQIFSWMRHLLAVVHQNASMTQNRSVQGFWRNWHASFNLWLVRYMYVPLGGSAWRGANVWPIFTFVALWHDLEWRLLAWAWLSCLLFAPELVSASGWLVWAGVCAWRSALKVECRAQPYAPQCMLGSACRVG